MLLAVVLAVEIIPYWKPVIVLASPIVFAVPITWFLFVFKKRPANASEAPLPLVSEDCMVFFLIIPVPDKRDIPLVTFPVMVLFVMVTLLSPKSLLRFIPR